MKQLWAPWRLEYIQAEPVEGCIFCDAPKKDPFESLVLFKGPVSMAMLNKFPYNSGHILLAPVRHVAKIEELTPEEGCDIFRLLRHSASVLQKELKPQGFNIGMNIGKAAGAGIDGHLHMHIVPRWNGDINFMPMLSEVKVIPEHIKTTFDKLAPHFKGL